MKSVLSSLLHRTATGGSVTVLAAAFFLGGCTPNNNTGGLGPLPKASFTVTPLSGVANTFVATAGTQGIFGWYWSPTSGSPTKAGGAIDTLYYPSHGNYRITLIAVGHGGYDTATQIVQVTSDDLSGNVIKGGQLTADSAAAWTILNTGGTQTTIAFTSSGVNFSNGSGSGTNGAIYQAVNVEAGTYKFSANVQGTGITNSWLEFYIGAAVPKQGSDYSDNKVYSLNFWAGCGLSAFNGDIVSIGCSGSGPASGAITFAQAGTVYVVIKGGSAGGSLGSGGVTITDIKMKKQ